MTYDALLGAVRRFGDVVEEAKKTSIHLVADSAFAGVAARRSKLVLTIKSPTEVKNPRIAKCEKLSANRWHFELHLESPKDVDAEVEAWLLRAYEISASRAALSGVLSIAQFAPDTGCDTAALDDVHRRRSEDSSTRNHKNG